MVRWKTILNVILVILTLINAAEGLQDTHCFAWYFLQKFLSKKLVKQVLFLAQNLISLAVFLNWWKSMAIICFYLITKLFPAIEYSMCTQGGCVIAIYCIPFYAAECVCSLSDSAFPALICAAGRGGGGNCGDYFILIHIFAGISPNINELIYRIISLKNLFISNF